MFKIAIFDLDGTILNTLDDLAKAANDALKAEGFPTHNKEQYKYFLGSGRYKLIERMLPEDKRQIEIRNKVLEQFNSFYEKYKNDNTKPYDGIEEVLKELKNSGVKLAVVSNKQHEFAQVIVEKYFSGIFDIVYGHRENYLPKPDPTTVLEVLHYFNIDKSDAVYIGDSDVDMATGKNAGLYSVGVAWGFRGAEELISSGADKVVYTAEQLKEVILG